MTQSHYIYIYIYNTQREREVRHVQFLFLRTESKNGPLYLLEATGEGVTVHPLVRRLRAYADGFAEYIAVRRLNTERTDEMRDFVASFAKEVG